MTYALDSDIISFRLKDLYGMRQKIDIICSVPGRQPHHGGIGPLASRVLSPAWVYSRNPQHQAF
jgi:hypothetical protein